jgi:hypothetical protein
MLPLRHRLWPRSSRTPHSFARSRKRRPVCESLEGRQLLTFDFSSAIGIGGNALTVGRIATDAAGDTFVTGSFTGKVNFDPSSGSNGQLDAGGTTSAFVAKYSPTNTLVWVKEFAADPQFLGSSASGVGIAVDNNTGSIYVVGTFSGTVDFDPSSSTHELSSFGAASPDGFIAKLTPDGSLDSGLVKRFGGPNQDGASYVSLSPDGKSVYVAGSFDGSADFDPGNSDFTLKDPSTTMPHAFALKLTNELGFVFVSDPGLSDVGATAITTDSVGNVYAVGNDVPTTNAFVAKFSSAGNVIAKQLFGGTVGGGTGAIATGVVTDSANNLYIAGGFMGTGDNFNATFGSATVALDSAGKADSYLIKLDPSFDLL